MSEVKFTPWFSAKRKPVRNGWYQATSEAPRENAYCYFWSGAHWFFGPDSAICEQQDKKWRGLTKPMGSDAAVDRK